MSKNKPLFPEFRYASSEDWLKAAATEINGGDPIQVLQWSLGKNIQFKPYYSAEDLKSDFPNSTFVIDTPDRPDARFWYNMPSTVVTTEAEANTTALEHLRAEADGIIFYIETKKDFASLLKGIEWENCPVSFVVANEEIKAQLVDFLKHQKLDVEKISGAVYSSVLAPIPVPAGNLKWNGIFVEASDPVSEVADALFKGVDLINSLGSDPRNAFKSICFNIPVGTTLLHDISKLKALRYLWAQVAHSYGMTDYNLSDLYIHGRSERWVNDQFQPHGNMLKSTTAAVAMICGGCNAITIEPEESTNATMRRIARNASFILKEESHLGKVSDPFGGAYVIEVLVDTIAREAWRDFQKAWEQKELVTQNA